jgi:hypothetical protein
MAGRKDDVSEQGAIFLSVKNANKQLHALSTQSNLNSSHAGFQQNIHITGDQRSVLHVQAPQVMVHDAQIQLDARGVTLIFITFRNSMRFSFSLYFVKI